MNSKFHAHGFEWGPADVSALFSDDKKGWITIGVRTAKTDIQIYVTKTGRIRVFGKNGEMTETPPGWRRVE